MRLYDDITIKPGHVGVVTSLCGADILGGDPPETEAEGFLVKPGSKGVLAGVLKEGRTASTRSSTPSRS